MSAKNKIFVLFAVLFLVCVPAVVIGINDTRTGWTVSKRVSESFAFFEKTAVFHNAGNDRNSITLEPIGACIRNYSLSRDYFVPTGTKNEWTSFFNNHPADLAPVGCDGDGECKVGAEDCHTAPVDCGACPGIVLTYIAGPGGTLTGSTTQTIISGGNGTLVTAVPDSGGTFLGWSDGNLSTNRAETNVTVSKTLTASFTQLCPGSVYDSRDGNTYGVKYMDGFCWTTSNMKYLPSVNATSNASVSSARYYVYGYSGTTVSSAKATNEYQDFGVLYNSTAADSACPAGYALPITYREWGNLSDLVGNDSGNLLYHMKSNNAVNSGNKLWLGSGSASSGDNSFGFNAFPGGVYKAVGQSFADKGYGTAYWARNYYNGSARMSYNVNESVYAPYNYSTSPCNPITSGITYCGTDSNANGLYVRCASPVSFTINYQAGANGYISGSTSQTRYASVLNEPSFTTAVNAVPNSYQYSFYKWSDGVRSNPRSDEVFYNMTVTALFAPNTCGNGTCDGIEQCSNSSNDYYSDLCWTDCGYCN